MVEDYNEETSQEGKHDSIQTIHCDSGLVVEIHEKVAAFSPTEVECEAEAYQGKGTIAKAVLRHTAATQTEEEQRARQR